MLTVDVMKTQRIGTTQMSYGTRLPTDPNFSTMNRDGRMLLVACLSRSDNRPGVYVIQKAFDSRRHRRDRTP